MMGHFDWLRGRSVHFSTFHIILYHYNIIYFILYIYFEGELCSSALHTCKYNQILCMFIFKVFLLSEVWRSCFIPHRHDMCCVCKRIRFFVLCLSNKCSCWILWSLPVHDDGSNWLICLHLKTCGCFTQIIESTTDYDSSKWSQAAPGEKWKILPNIKSCRMTTATKLLISVL